MECLTSWWGGEGGVGGPRDGLTRSGSTSGHTECGALDKDSEATEEGTPYNVPAYTYHHRVRRVATAAFWRTFSKHLY